MKKFTAATIGTLFMHSCSAMQVTMPDAPTLHQTFNNLVLNNVVAETEIVPQLAGNTFQARVFTQTLYRALDEYTQHIQNPVTSMQIRMIKPVVVRNLLSAYPDAIQELERYKII